MSPENPTKPNSNREMAVPVEEEISRTFESQWAKPETVDFSGDAVEIYDVRPEVDAPEVPVALVPGWGGTPEMYRENVKTFVVKNRRTISVNAPHGIAPNKEQYSTDEIDKIPDAELRKIASLMASLDAKKIDKTDAVGHSQGCLDIILAATLYPERFEDIVLVNPAGMIGKDNFWRLATGFSVDVVKGYADTVRRSIMREPGVGGTKKVTLEPMLRAIRAVNGSVVQDPVKSFREVLAISDAEIHEMLIGLREKGIGISVVSAVDDEAFPSERMQKIVTKEMVDGFYVVKGKHSQFQLEAGPYTELAAAALLAMKEKRKKKSQKNMSESTPT